MTTKEAVMTTQDVTNRFNELAQTGQWGNIQNEMYAANAVSTEPANSPGLKTAEGIEAIREKATSLEKWEKKCTVVIPISLLLQAIILP